MKRLFAALILSFALFQVAHAGVPLMGGAAPPAGCGAPCGPGSGNQFYIDPVNGNNAFNGRSPGAPWRDLTPTQTTVFPAGFGLYLLSGQNVTGCLTLNRTNVPVSGVQPIIVNTYGGATKATITSNCPGVNAGSKGPRSAAITIDSISNISVQNLNVRGSAGSPTQFGIALQSSIHTASDITIQGMDISGFYTTAPGDYGSEIQIQGLTTGSTCSFFNTVLLNNTLHGSSGPTSLDDNGLTGFSLGKNVCNITEQGNVVYNMGGKPNVTSEGNGLLTIAVQNATVQWNIAHDNGANTSTCGGPAAIWSYYADNVDIRQNEVYNQQPVGGAYTGCDQTPYDLDGGTTNSTLELNYSHHNYGGITLFMGAQSGVGWGPNNVRFNISEGDDYGNADTTQGSLFIVGGASPGFVNITNNVFWQNTAGTGTSCPAVLAMELLVPTGGTIANNIFGATKSSASCTGSGTGKANFLSFNIQTAPGVTFKNNDYFAIDAGTFNVYRYGASNYGSLAAWQAVAPGGDANSLTVDPLLVSPGGNVTCGSTAGPQSSGCPSGYALQGGSPMLGAGANLSSIGTTGFQDYYSNAVPNASASGYNIGADNHPPITTQPSWAMTGVNLACNFQVILCWQNGVGMIPVTTVIQTTRTSAESCVTASTVTYAGPNTPCVTSAGLQQFGAATNLLKYSTDLSNAAWQNYLSTGTGSPSMSFTANAAVAPDGQTTATQIAVQRTVGGFTASAFRYENFASSAGLAYAGSIWLKATGADIGKAISLTFNCGGSTGQFGLKDITLTGTWTNYSTTISNAPANPFCSMGVGYYGGSSNGQIGTTTFLAWGGQVEVGTSATPIIPTASVAVTRTIDNITAIGPLATLLSGGTGTAFFQEIGLKPSTVSTLLDSNGVTFLGENATNNLTSSLGGSLTTANAPAWDLQTTSAESWSPAGRTLALNFSTGVTDTNVITPVAPFHIGSTGGTTSPVNANLQLFNIFNSVQTVSNPGTGQHYYVANAGCNDLNTGLTGHPWCTPARVNAQTYFAGDTVSFNGGDSFTGCLRFDQFTNVSSSSKTNPITVNNYGTGAATITSNCGGLQNSKGINTGLITVNGVNGFVENGVALRGNASSPFTGYGVLLQNSNSSFSNSMPIMDTLTIENSDMQGFRGNEGNGGADVFLQGFPGNKTGAMTNVTILNNTMHGALITSAEDNGVLSIGFGANLFNVNIQGNLVYNMGGRTGTFNGQTGNGIEILGGNIVTMQDNVTHDIGADTHSCGGPVGIWADASTLIDIKFNESYGVQPVPFVAGCDWDGFDFDGGVTSSVMEYNYSHNNYGFGYLGFTSTAGGFTWGPNTFRFNISENDAIGGRDNTQGNIEICCGNPATVYIYNNTVWNGNTTNRNVDFAYTVPLTGVVANNIFAAARDNLGIAGFVQCNNKNSPNLLWAANDYFAITGSAPRWFGCNSPTTTYTSLAAWQAATPNGDVGATTANPLLTAGGSGGTCASTSGPQPCPSAYVLTPVTSPMFGAGVNLALPPYNLPTGSRDYYGNIVPNASTSGFNIGADNSYPTPPTCSNALDFSAACNSQYFGKGIIN